jgi:hypothetical protein
MMYDLRAGTPLGSSSISMGFGGFAAGYSLSITVDPQWWLAMIFTGIGAAVGESMVPVVRSFIGEEQTAVQASTDWRTTTSHPPPT